MQKIYSFSIILLMSAFMAASSGVKAGTIISAQDGNWNVASTWIGGAVPASADSVVVKHLVNVSNGDLCNHLYVSSSGTVQSLINAARTLVVTGNLWVDGTMKMSNYSLYVKLGGNLHLNGVWSSPLLNFTGTSAQVVSATPGKIFAAASGSIIFKDDDPTSPVKFATDLTFNNIEFNGNSTTVEFAPGIEVAFYTKPLRNTNIIGHSSALLMRNGAYLEGSNFSDLTLKGLFTIGNANTSSGELIVADTLQNLLNATRTLTVDGNFTNNGLIRNTNYNFDFILKGNVTNNGIWRCGKIYFDGTADQHIASLPGTNFNCDGLEDRNIISKIILDDDLEIRKAKIDLKSATLKANGTKIVLRENAYLTNATIDNAKLGGVFFCTSNCTFSGTTTVVDTLQNSNAYANSILDFTGNLINNGRMTRANNSYGLVLNINADFAINGPIDIKSLTFAGASDQAIYGNSNGSIIDVDNVYDTNASSDIIFDSDITFIGSTWALTGATINLDEGNFTMQGGTLEGGQLISNGKYFSQTGDAKFTNMQITGTRLKGVCQVYGDQNRFTDVTVEDTLQDYSYYYYPILSIDGLFTNNGIVKRSNNYGLRVYLHNDFINNGPMDIDHLTFAGAADQTISSTAKSGLVTVDNVYDTVAESDIVFGSDFTFVNSVWNLAGATIDLQGGNFTMQNGDLQNGLLRSSNKYIRQIGDARLTNMQMSDIRLKGFCQIYGDGSHFTDVVVEDTLRNYNTYYSPTVTTSGDFINNGYITQWSSYSIYFNVQDVVINNGYWLSQKIIFGGNDMHYIGSQNAKVFNIANITASIDAGDVTVLSDLYLLNANVNLGGKNLYIPAGGTLNLDGGTIQSTLVTGNESATIHCSNAPLFDISTFTNVIISGTVNTKVNTFADCELEGLMQNFIYYFSPTISFEGNFTNTGTLSNAPAWSYKLSNNVFGNVYNSGTWEIAESNWKGLLDQDIYLMDDSEINTPSKFLAMLGTGNYQWYKNNVAINGATTNHLDFAAITVAERGFYHCTTNAGTSRTVRICTPIQISLADEAFFCQNESVMIEATPTSGQGPYIYSWTPAAGLSNPNIRNPLANPAQPTLYTCTITDAIGCSGEATILVQQYPQLYVQAGADDQICAGSSTSLSGSASGGALNYGYAWTPAAGLSNPNLPNPAASPSLTTTYTLTVTDGNGCQATDQVTITVNPLPIAYQLSLGGHFCAGVQAAIVKIADSEIGVNYYLRRNNQNTGVVMPGTGSAITFFTIPLAGTYTVKGINATTGCEKMMTGSVSVIIDNAPVITNQSGDDQKIVGSSKSFFVNATGTAPLTYAWYFEGDLVQSGAQNTYTKSNLTLGDAGEYWCIVSNNCGFEQSATIVLTVLDKQSVVIPKGWSGVSTYLNIWDNQVSDIFQSISNSLILVNDFEHIYWPGQNINTYPNGAWDTYTGAQIKLSAPATVDFIGLPLNDLTVDLTETWTYLPVLHQTPVAAEDLFMQAQPQIVIAKEIAGTGVYWPQYGINTLNVLTPGRAYLVKVSGSTSVDFDLVAKSGVISINPGQPENASPWNDPVYSNSSHTIALTNEVAASTLKPGDWFGVFNADGICCGIMKFDGNSTAITAFGDDPTTNDVDGMVENDRMFFKAYRSATDEMFDLQVGFDASANESAYFIANGMSVISDLKAEATGVSDAEQNLIRVYPNPTNGILNIEGISADSKIEITNAAGQLIYKSDTRGSQTINLGGQARGLYNVRITNQQFTTTRKVMVE